MTEKIPIGPFDFYWNPRTNKPVKVIENPDRMRGSALCPIECDFSSASQTAFLIQLLHEFREECFKRREEDKSSFSEVKKIIHEEVHKALLGIYK